RPHGTPPATARPVEEIGSYLFHTRCSVGTHPAPRPRGKGHGHRSRETCTRRRPGGVCRPGLCHRGSVPRRVAPDPERHRPCRGCNAEGAAQRLAGPSTAPRPDPLRGLVVSAPRARLLRRGPEVPPLGAEPGTAVG